MRYIEGYRRESADPYSDAIKKRDDAAKEISKMGAEADSMQKKVDEAKQKSQAATECGDGEASLTAFISGLKKQQDAVTDTSRLNNDPVVKNNILKNELVKCKNDSLNHMLGNMYLKTLPTDTSKDPDIDEPELRKDLEKFVADKGGPVAYIKDGCLKEKGKDSLAAKVLNRMLEAADEACTDFGAKMGIGFNNRTADEIKFSLDNEDQIRQKLDNVTDEVDFNEITDAIRNNVTNAALAEIDRSQKEKEAADQLEEVLRNNEEITTEESVQEVLKDRKVADDIPSLMESIMIGKSKTFNESTTREEWDKMFVESVCEYAKHALTQGLGVQKYDRYSMIKLASAYRK